MFKLNSFYLSISRSDLFKNGFWGLTGRIFETLFLTLFFIIISQRFITNDFAIYLLSNNIYQLLVGFSTMGLGSWFIREHANEPKKSEFFNKFLKIQIGLGIFFYLFNVCLIFMFYHDEYLRIISIVLGINIIFDNIIYALRSLNIAELQQRKTAIIMAIDGLLKLAISCLLFVYPFSVLTLSIFLVVIRFFTVNLFIRIGFSTKINLVKLLYSKISFPTIKEHLFSNWRFGVIVWLSIVFWRSATIIISQFLALNDVANYEIAYKVFSVFLILPMIVSTTIYPKFVQYFANNNNIAIIKLYKNVFIAYSIFCMLSYAFIQSFADIVIPYIFGKNYLQAAVCLKDMFLTFLIFPTALLQANLLVAIKLEKIDMYLNMIALTVFYIGCFVGLYFYKALFVINYSIFGAFFLFHFIQNILLSKFKFASLKISFGFYFVLLIFIVTYQIAIIKMNGIIIFVCFVCIVTSILIYFIYKNYNSWFYPSYASIESED